MMHGSTGADRIVNNEIGKDKIGEEETRMQYDVNQCDRIGWCRITVDGMG